jgi:hypothetical protein
MAITPTEVALPLAYFGDQWTILDFCAEHDVNIRTSAQFMGAIA